MGLNVTDDHGSTGEFLPLGGLQHRVGFSHARSHAKKNTQLPALLAQCHFPNGRPGLPGTRLELVSHGISLLYPAPDSRFFALSTALHYLQNGLPSGIPVWDPHLRSPAGNQSKKALVLGFGGRLSSQTMLRLFNICAGCLLVASPLAAIPGLAQEPANTNSNARVKAILHYLQGLE